MPVFYHSPLLTGT